MNTTCPTDDRLKQLIQEAFSESVLPDPVRLQQIENRLTNKVLRSNKNATPARSGWPIWILLAASASATAWWGSQYFTEESAPESEIISSQPVVPHTDVTNEPTPPDDDKTPSSEQATSSHQNSPIIDRRERY